MALAPAFSSRRVLVVDDNLDSAESITMLLQVWGHDVRTVHGGLLALEAARAFEPEVVLLDIGLPDLDGFQVATRLRADLGSKAFLVAITGYGQEEDRRRSREAGFDCHLTKPWEPQLLERLVGTMKA